MAYPTEKPPAYDNTMNSAAQSHAVELSTSSESPRSTSSTMHPIQKPIVVPQTTNILYIRSFSPFARAYPPFLASLPNPITQAEFLAFIDGLNSAFTMHPFFLAAFLAGGAAMSAPLLPVQLAGGGLQAAAALSSGAVTLVRGRAYLKRANAATFHPRGLVARLCTTRKMMAAVGLGGAAKLALPPLDDLDGSIADDDPRSRRLRALDGLVAPLTFVVAPPADNGGALKRYSTAPSRWLNDRSERKLIQGREKGRRLQRERAATQGTTGGERTEELAGSLEERRAEEVRGPVGKKMKKSERREERVANRILWVVVTRLEDAPLSEEDGNDDDDEFEELSEMAEALSARP